MQKIRSFLKIGTSGALLCDSFGSDTGITLELMLGTGVILEFELHNEAVGESAELPDYPLDELDFAAGYCAFDLTCTNSDDPPLLILSGITLTRDAEGHTIFSVPVNNSATARIVEAIGTKSEQEFFCEIGGFDQDGKPVFAWQFPVTLRNRVYRGNGGESIVDDPAYLTAVQVRAIAAGLEEKINAVSATPDSGTVTAANLNVNDVGIYFTAANVEDVLQEIGSQLAGVNSLLEEI